MININISYLEELNKKELEEIYNLIWGEAKHKYNKKDYIKHIGSYAVQYCIFCNDEKLKDKFLPKLKNLNNIINKYKRLSLEEYNKLQIKLAKEKNEPLKNWIKKYGKDFKVIIKEIRIKNLDKIKKILYNLNKEE